MRRYNSLITIPAMARTVLILKRAGNPARDSRNRGIRGIRGRRETDHSIFRVFRVFRGSNCAFALVHVGGSGSSGNGLVASDLEEYLFEVGVVLLDQVGNPPLDLQLALVDDGDAVADGFDFAQLMGGEENGFAFVP